MELLVHHQDLKFPLKCQNSVFWWHGRFPSSGLHIMVCSAYYGMHCISWNALHSDNRPLCRCKKNFTNYDKYENSKVANLQHFSIIRCIWYINEQKIKVWYEGMCRLMWGMVEVGTHAWEGRDEERWDGTRALLGYHGKIFLYFPPFFQRFYKEGWKDAFCKFTHISGVIWFFSRKIMHFVACQVWCPQTTEYQECELTSLTSSVSLVA